MSDDPRRLEGGKFFLDIAKYILTAAAVTSLITERVNVTIGIVGLVAGGIVALIGVLILPPKKKDKKEEEE